MPFQVIVIIIDYPFLFGIVIITVIDYNKNVTVITITFMITVVY